MDGAIGVSWTLNGAAALAIYEAAYEQDQCEARSTGKTTSMINLAITFLVIALIAAVLGFTSIAGTAMGFAKIAFVVFLVLFIVSFVMGRRAPRG